MAASKSPEEIKSIIKAAMEQAEKLASSLRPEVREKTRTQLLDAIAKKRGFSDFKDMQDAAEGKIKETPKVSEKPSEKPATKAEPTKNVTPTAKASKNEGFFAQEDFTPETAITKSSTKRSISQAQAKKDMAEVLEKGRTLLAKVKEKTKDPAKIERAAEGIFDSLAKERGYLSAMHMADVSDPNRPFYKGYAGTSKWRKKSYDIPTQQDLADEKAARSARRSQRPSRPKSLAAERSERAFQKNRESAYTEFLGQAENAPVPKGSSEFSELLQRVLPNDPAIQAMAEDEQPVLSRLDDLTGRSRIVTEEGYTPASGTIQNEQELRNQIISRLQDPAVNPLAKKTRNIPPEVAERYQKGLHKFVSKYKTSELEKAFAGRADIKKDYNQWLGQMYESGMVGDKNKLISGLGKKRINNLLQRLVKNTPPEIPSDFSTKTLSKFSTEELSFLAERILGESRSKYVQDFAEQNVIPDRLAEGKYFETLPGKPLEPTELGPKGMAPGDLARIETETEAPNFFQKAEDELTNQTFETNKEKVSAIKKRAAELEAEYNQAMAPSKGRAITPHATVSLQNAKTAQDLLKEHYNKDVRNPFEFVVDRILEGKGKGSPLTEVELAKIIRQQGREMSEAGLAPGQFGYVRWNRDPQTQALRRLLKDAMGDVPQDLHDIPELIEDPKNGLLPLKHTTYSKKGNELIPNTSEFNVPESLQTKYSSAQDIYNDTFLSHRFENDLRMLTSIGGSSHKDFPNLTSRKDFANAFARILEKRVRGLATKDPRIKTEFVLSSIEEVSRKDPTLVKDILPVLEAHIPDWPKLFGNRVTYLSKLVSNAEENPQGIINPQAFSEAQRMVDEVTNSLRAGRVTRSKVASNAGITYLNLATGNHQNKDAKQLQDLGNSLKRQLASLDEESFTNKLDKEGNVVLDEKGKPVLESNKDTSRWLKHDEDEILSDAEVDRDLDSWQSTQAQEDSNELSKQLGAEESRQNLSKIENKEIDTSLNKRFDFVRKVADRENIKGETIGKISKRFGPHLEKLKASETEFNNKLAELRTQYRNALDEKEKSQIWRNSQQIGKELKSLRFRIKDVEHVQRIAEIESRPIASGMGAALQMKMPELPLKSYPPGKGLPEGLVSANKKLNSALQIKFAMANTRGNMMRGGSPELADPEIARRALLRGEGLAPDLPMALQYADQAPDEIENLLSETGYRPPTPPQPQFARATEPLEFTPPSGAENARLAQMGGGLAYASEGATVEEVASKILSAKPLDPKVQALIGKAQETPSLLEFLVRQGGPKKAVLEQAIAASRKAQPLLVESAAAEGAAIESLAPMLRRLANSLFNNAAWTRSSFRI